MKKRKLVATLLVAAMAGSVFTACSKKSKSSNNGEVLTEISEDTPWYTITECMPDEDFKTKEYSYSWTNTISKMDDGVLLMINAEKPVPENIQETDYNMADYSVYEVRYVTYDGEIKYSANIPLDQVDADYFYPGSASVVNGVVLITGDAYDKNWNCESYNITVDVETGKVSDWAPSTAFGDVPATTPPKVDNGNLEKEIKVGDYLVELYWAFTPNDEYYNTLFVTDANGNVTEFDMRDSVTNMKDIWGVSGGLTIDDHTLLFQIDGNSGSDSYTTCLYELDLEALTFVDKTEDYSWVKSDALYSVSYFEGQGCYGLNSQKGIFKLDFENKKIDYVLTTDNCNVNPSKLGDLEILDITDDNFVLAGDVYIPQAGGTSKDYYYIMTLTKADKNPNAGKDVIKVASMTGYTYAIYEAICKYNETSDSAFMVIDRRYDITEVDMSSYDNYEDYEKVYYQRATDLGDKLTVDIMAGDGPDILFNANSLPQLNNSNYLIDLMDITTDGNYYSNVFDACSVDGKLYQMPLTISVTGITTTKDYVKDGQVGFTFEEYKEFVKTVCNGSDPLSFDNMGCFDLLYATIAADLRSGNKIDFNNVLFKELAEYCKNDVTYTEPEYGDGGVWYEEEEWSSPVASYGTIGDISNFFYQYGDNAEAARILGLPSADGRGPQFAVYSSIAISAQSKNLDACKDFAKSLLNDDNQKLLASFSWESPINKDVVYEIGKIAIEDHNRQVEENKKWFSEEEIIMYNLPSTVIDESAIEYFIKIFESCSSCATDDISIKTIIHEEIQAYFAGQKDLDSVIDIMSNKVTTYLSERG